MVQENEIQELLTQLGPINPNIAEVWQVEAQTWAIAYDEDMIISLKFDARQKKLVMAVNLGSPIEANKLQVYETLLAYNMLWEDTGGIKMALANDEVMQLFELSLHTQPILDELKEMIDNFVSKALLWRGYVTSGASIHAGKAISSHLWV